MESINDWRLTIVDFFHNRKSKIENQQYHACVFLALLVLLLVLSVPVVVMACPLCKEALFDPAQSATQSRVVQGYAISIAVLLGIPLALIGGIATLLVRSTHRANDRETLH